MRNTVILLCILLCPLLSCYTSQSIPPNDTIYFVAEDETKTYQNQQYLPLLEILDRYMDFHQTEIKTRVNPYAAHDEEKVAKEQLDSLFKKYTTKMQKLIQDLHQETLKLLKAEQTIDEYLKNMIHIYDFLYTGRIATLSKFLDRFPGVENRLFPTSERLFNFLMEDKQIFEGYEASNEITRINTINKYMLLPELVQTAVSLTDTNQLDRETIELLARCGIQNEYIHPDELGGPYMWLEDLLNDRLTPRVELKPNKLYHVKELKRLINFNQLVRRARGNAAVLMDLFDAIKNHDDPLVTYHFLSLIEDSPIKIFLGKKIPSYLTCEEDKSGNCRIIYLPSPVPKPISKPKEESSNWTSESLRPTPQGHRKNKNVKQQNSTESGIPISPGRKKNMNVKQRNSATLYPQRDSSKKSLSTEERSSVFTNPSPTTLVTKPKEPLAQSLVIQDNISTIEPLVLTDLLPVSADPISDEPAGKVVEEKKGLVESMHGREDYISSPINPSINTTQTIDLPVLETVSPTVFNTPVDKSMPKEKTKKSTLNNNPDPQLIPLSPSLTIVARPSDQTLPSQQELSVNKPPKVFTLPAGLRSFHKEIFENAHPIVINPKNQANIDQLFNSGSQHSITYHLFAKKIWEPNGGIIKLKSGSHATLQFPSGKNIFGIYRPHGKDDFYPVRALQYLRAATLYIGLRPTDW